MRTHSNSDLTPRERSEVLNNRTHFFSFLASTEFPQTEIGNDADDNGFIKLHEKMNMLQRHIVRTYELNDDAANVLKHDLNKLAEEINEDFWSLTSACYYINTPVKSFLVSYDTKTDRVDVNKLLFKNS